MKNFNKQVRFGLRSSARLGPLLAAVFFFATPASADVFHTTGSGPLESEVANRLAAIEKRLSEMGPRGAAPGAPVGPGASGFTLPEPPDALAPRKETDAFIYTVVGVLNGRYLVRQGETLRVLSPTDYESFRALTERQYAQAKALLDQQNRDSFNAERAEAVRASAAAASTPRKAKGKSAKN